tara:strand:+ start:123 stop:1976 length:1854 start_codon:yes stop_codon:yes gene_type:complete
MSELIFKIAPYRDEGEMGYLLRLAQENYLRVRDLVEQGLSFDPVVLHSNGLMPSFDLDPDLWAWVSRQAKLRKEKARIWNIRQARFCPHCLTEEGTWHASWELFFYDACHHHQVWMIDTCTSCNQPISWKRSQIVRCVCGADLRCEPARPAPIELYALSKLLWQKLHEESDIDILPMLQGLDLEQLCRLVRYLGIHLDVQTPHGSIKVANLSRMEVSWPISTYAASVLSSWPKAFEKAFTAMQRSASTERNGLAPKLQKAYTYIYRGLKEPEFDWLRKEFEHWFVSNWIGAFGKRNRRLSEKLWKRMRWIPGNEAATKLGLSVKRLRQLVADGAIEGSIHIAPKSKRKFLMIPSEEMERLRDNPLNEINLNDVMSLLGLGKIRTRGLVVHLFPAATRNPSVRGNASWRIDRADVERYLAVGKDSKLMSVPDEHQVDFAHILRYWNWDQVEVIDFILDVCDGKLEIEGQIEGVRGFSRWVFDRGRVRAWRARHTPEVASFVSIPQFAKLIGVKQEVAYWLARNGFIELTRPISKRKGCGARVSRDEIKRFDASYVFASELAEQLKTSSRKLVELLGDEGLYPASGTGIEGCYKVFFEKTPELLEYLRNLRVEIPPREI